MKQANQGRESLCVLVLGDVKRRELYLVQPTEVPFTIRSKVDLLGKALDGLASAMEYEASMLPLVVIGRRHQIEGPYRVLLV